MKFTEFGMCVEITIPMRYMDVLYDGDAPTEPVPGAVNYMTKLAGGVTYTEARGQWYDDNDQLVEEDVLVYKWWMPRGVSSYEATTRIVQALFKEGEKAVLVQESDRRGTQAFLITP